VAAEIEGKTAMTLLSKPITRRQFILGKYLGIFNASLLLLIPMSIVMLLLLYYKVGYDARETSADAPDFGERMFWVVRMLPGILLSIMEIAVLTALSVAISTRVPMVVNLVTCLTIFVVGHLTPILVGSSLELNEIVQCMGQVIATVLPQLDNFNITAAIATGTLVPPTYLAWAFVYCLAYASGGVLLAFILFEDRDLA
jgi:ABC-type transport system involved in multi-copper enzyme maturation permease subunit